MLHHIESHTDTARPVFPNNKWPAGADTEGVGGTGASIQVCITYTTHAQFMLNAHIIIKCIYFQYSDRLGHVINNDTTEQSPLLLLFLDCVWQLLQQFPSDFEYSETFLTTVWDSAFVPIFDTFQFNSEHDRQVARKNVSKIVSHHL